MVGEGGWGLKKVCISWVVIRDFRTLILVMSLVTVTDGGLMTVMWSDDGVSGPCIPGDVDAELLFSL